MIERMDHEFVEFIPEQLEDGKIYVSLEYGTAVHRCASGCGQKVVTPITPTDWSIKYNGETVSLEPSIGNWNFECRSHYWIKNGKIVWSGQWSQEEVDANRARDRSRKEAFYGQRRSLDAADPQQPKKTKSRLRRIFGRLFRR